MSTFTFRVDDDILDLMKKYPEINWSKEIREFVTNRAKDEFRHHPFASDSPFRTVKYKDKKITVNARLGEFGPTDWSLDIVGSEGSRQIIELGGMPWVERIVRGVSDYFHHEALRMQKIDLSRIVHRDSLTDLWLTLAKWARKYHLALSADVALLPSESIRVLGKMGQSDFCDEVTPKDWGDVRKDEDQINVFFSNFWIGSYVNTDGTVFRLSSYLSCLTKNLDVSKKSATRYVDFNPDNEEHEKEIKKLLSLASVIYLPDVSINNVHSIFLERFNLGSGMHRKE